MKKTQLTTVLVAGLTLLLASCSKEKTNNSAQQGSLAMSITDAPIDNASISGAFVTIAGIKVDGQPFGGFSGPKTINLLELQNGASLNLGAQLVTAGKYATITLVLNSETDAAGNAPGCYLQLLNGTKEKLELSGNGATELVLNPKDIFINAGQTTEIIMDFDLRKAIKSNQNDYSFVTLGSLKSAVRAETKTETGIITGKIENYTQLTGSAVVYAYKKGTFNAAEPGSGETGYANAVTSAKVDAAGNFTLSFLPAGEYEIVAEKIQPGGPGLLLKLSSNINLTAIPVSAKSQTNLTLSIVP